MAVLFCTVILLSARRLDGHLFQSIVCVCRFVAMAHLPLQTQV